MKKEIPILFSTHMVQAILAGRKTQTRRIVKWPNVPSWHDYDYEPNVLTSQKGSNDWWPEFQHRNGLGKDISGPVRCPFGKPGDVLWVRETWKPKVFAAEPIGGFDYYADRPEGADKHYGLEFYGSTGKRERWRPSIHMPKEATRIWLEVESVRVERLQEISEDDAIAEGIESFRNGLGRLRFRNYNPTQEEIYAHTHGPYPSFGVAVTSVASLWSVINGPESWEQNPWVWVVSFKVLSTTGRPASLTNQ